MKPFLALLSHRLSFGAFLLVWPFFAQVLTHSVLSRPIEFPLLNQVIYFGYRGLFFAIAAGFIVFIVKNFSSKVLVVDRYTVLILLYLCSASLSLVLNRDYIGGSRPFLLLSLVVMPAVICLIFTWCLTAADARKVQWALLAFGLVNLPWAWFQLADFYFFEGMFNANSISGAFGDRNLFSRYYTIISAFLLIDAIRHRGDLNLTHLPKLLAWGLILVTLSLQQSRSGYIIYVLSTLAIFFSTKSKKVRRLGLLLACVLIVVFGFFINMRMQRDKVHIVNYSDLERVYLLKVGWNMVAHFPVFGVGYSLSESRIKEFADKKYPGLEGINAIHNSHLKVWAEQGTIGLAIFLALNLGLIVQNIRIFRRTGWNDEGVLGLFCAISLSIFMIQGMVYHTFDYEGPYWLIIALGIMSIRGAKSRDLQATSFPQSESEYDPHTAALRSPSSRLTHRSPSGPGP